MTRVLGVLLLLQAMAMAPAAAQSTADRASSEELEPRIIGTMGATMFGFAGFVDRFLSSENDLPTHYTAQIDVGRFLTDRFMARGGLAGSGSYGGDPDERVTGSSAPALHAFGGLLYYFTPRSMWSAYSGGEYWAQLTQRTEGDAGSIVAKLGIQGAVSSRASLFIESGYGFGLTRGEGRTTRFTGQIGVRLKF